MSEVHHEIGKIDSVISRITRKYEDNPGMVSANSTDAKMIGDYAKEAHDILGILDKALNHDKPDDLLAEMKRWRSDYPPPRKDGWKNKAVLPGAMQAFKSVSDEAGEIWNDWDESKKDMKRWGRTIHDAWDNLGG